METIKYRITKRQNDVNIYHWDNILKGWFKIKNENQLFDSKKDAEEMCNYLSKYVPFDSTVWVEEVKNFKTGPFEKKPWQI